MKSEPLNFTALMSFIHSINLSRVGFQKSVWSVTHLEHVVRFFDVLMSSIGSVMMRGLLGEDLKILFRWEMMVMMRRFLTAYPLDFSLFIQISLIVIGSVISSLIDRVFQEIVIWESLLVINPSVVVSVIEIQWLKVDHSISVISYHMPNTWSLTRVRSVGPTRMQERNKKTFFL